MYPDITNFLHSDNNLSPHLTSNSSDPTSNLQTLDPSIVNSNNPIKSTLFSSGAMSSFETLASLSDLDPKHQESAHAVVNQMDGNTGLIALTVYIAQCHQDIFQRLAPVTPSQPSASAPTSTITLTQPLGLFKVTVVLKVETTKLVLKYIGDPTLEAYTDTEGITAPDGRIGSLDNSLGKAQSTLKF
ncbi:hypothetical protein CROQUDRAFT_134656 [Cronartium quercuum f. sp. fusiforme G11]|uniref:Uncharacterized protein n=1 Tax=Cronartium quercuum f. sp. fusiforme G11 TaxID=708437 RepID=A0A9P6T9T4_9BASI|nr:hypothetical protein CROQUDRAFT_134656 [Cronartium quercuum f. sp. fusiforme G11]